MALFMVSDEARAKAINLYKILAGVQFLLGVGLLICGGFGTVYTNEDSEEDIGPPFFLGGFLVGSAVNKISVSIWHFECMIFIYACVRLCVFVCSTVLFLFISFRFILSKYHSRPSNCWKSTYADGR